MSTFKEEGGEVSPENLSQQHVMFSPEQLHEIGLCVLERAGALRETAKIQIDALLAAEMKGHPSHGFLRLPRLVARIEAGVARPNARGLGRWRGRAALELDGQRGLGPVVMETAAESLCAVVDEMGVALATIHNANHIGMLAFYAEKLAHAGFVSILFSTSEALVHPWGGRTAMIGTNPIAIGAPVQGTPFVVDLATSQVAMGKVHHYADTGRPLEAGWALDAQGNPTLDARAAREGAIAPFGGAKGYALGLAFEILVASLTDTALGRDVVGTLDATEICNKGDVLFVMRPRAAGATIACYLEDIRQTPPIIPGDRVSVPGDRAAARQKAISEQGIALPEALAQELARLSGERGGQR